LTSDFFTVAVAADCGLLLLFFLDSPTGFSILSWATSLTAGAAIVFFPRAVFGFTNFSFIGASSSSGWAGTASTCFYNFQQLMTSFSEVRRLLIAYAIYLEGYVPFYSSLVVFSLKPMEMIHPGKEVNFQRLSSQAHCICLFLQRK